MYTDTMNTKMQDPTVVLSVRVRPDQKAMLWQYGKDNGCLSISEATRRFIDDFVEVRRKAHSQQVANALASPAGSGDGHD